MKDTYNVETILIHLFDVMNSNDNFKNDFIKYLNDISHSKKEVKKSFNELNKYINELSKNR